MEEIVKLTRITPYFIEQMKELADFDFSLDGQNWDSLSAETLRQAKEMGFSDKYLAQIFGVPERPSAPAGRKTASRPPSESCPSAAWNTRNTTTPLTAARRTKFP